MFFFLTVRDKWGLQMYWPSFLAWLVGSVSNTFLTSVFTVVQSAPWSSALDTKEIIYLTLGCSEFFILGIMCSMCCLDAKLHSTVLTRILKNKWRNGWCTKPEKSLHLLVQSLTENSGTFIGVQLIQGAIQFPNCTFRPFIKVLDGLRCPMDTQS